MALRESNRFAMQGDSCSDARQVTAGHKRSRRRCVGYNAFDGESTSGETTLACIVHRKDPKTGTVYAYSSRSYRDPETKKVKTEKTYLGRVDPETGEIIPKATGGRRNRTPVGAQTEVASNVASEPVPSSALDSASENVLARIGELEEQVRRLESEVARLRSEAEAREGLVRAIVEAAYAYRTIGEQ